MQEILLTKELYDFIDEQCEAFNDKTHYGVDVNDILFSLLHNENFDQAGPFLILNDWDEGKGNDPWWNDELNEHSAVCFIMEVCKAVSIKVDPALSNT